MISVDVNHRLSLIRTDFSGNRTTKESTEELFCMLIVLKQNNEEISRTLGITRSSVLKNRYRLRTKLGLPEGCDLDSEVRALLLPK